MILLRIGVEGASDELADSLIRHLEMQAGLWSLLHRQGVQVQSMTIPTPEQKLDSMVLG